MGRDLLAATEAIYSRRDAGRDWTAVVTELARLAGASSGCVVVTDSSDDRPTVGCFDNIDPEWIGAYDAHYHRFDPTLELLRERPGQVHVDHVTGERPADLTGAARTFYHEFMRPQSVRHTLALRVPGQSGLDAALILQRSAARGPFGNRAVDALDRLATHLQRSLDLQAHLDRIGAVSGGFRNALEQAPLGVLLLNARGRPVFVNERAESILGATRQLALEAHGLTSPNAATDRRLTELIRGAALAARGAVDHHGGRLVVDCPGGEDGLQVQVDPLHTTETEDAIGTLEPRVLVWITPAAPSGGPCARGLREAYPLTAAEADVLAALVDGASLAEVAAARRVSRETVRTQLKSVMSKFGVSRQADLLRCVLRGGAASGDGQP